MISNLSIRTRLTLWYAIVLGLILAGFGTAIYWMTADQLMERIDAGLDEELSDVIGEVKRSHDQQNMLSWLERRFAHHEGFNFQVTDSSGNQLFANDRLRKQRLPVADALINQAVHVTSLVNDAGRYRIVSQRVDGPQGILTVEVARSLEAYDHELNEYLAILLVLGPIALALTLASGYFLARRALAPVDRMTETANRIDARRLGERLESSDSADELGRLSATLNGMLDRLQNSFLEMQRFTADASHELRTPLSIIQTEAELAIAKPLGDIEKQELLGSILEECRRLSWITDQLLTLCREDAGIVSAKRELIDVSRIAALVIETMQPLADSKQQTLVYSSSAPAIITGDQVRLRHVFYNLVENALKYSDEGGRIEVMVRPDNDQVRIQVNDNGMGIPEEHLPHIFDRFYRVDKARGRSEGGTGLGLSIVQSIVMAHQGSIKVTSTLGHGTTFTIELPRLKST